MNIRLGDGKEKPQIEGLSKDAKLILFGKAIGSFIIVWGVESESHLKEFSLYYARVKKDEQISEKSVLSYTTDGEKISSIDLSPGRISFFRSEDEETRVFLGNYKLEEIYILNEEI